MFPFSDDDLKPAVENILESKVKPSLALDGGGIELVNIKNAKVYVKLQGACIGCASSTSTITHIVEKSLKSYIHPDIEVINIPV